MPLMGHYRIVPILPYQILSSTAGATPITSSICAGYRFRYPGRREFAKNNPAENLRGCFTLFVIARALARGDLHYCF